MSRVDIHQMELLGCPPGMTLECPPGVERWTCVIQRVHPHPTLEIGAMDICGGSGGVEGVGFWSLETGELIRWQPATYAFSWLPQGREAAAVTEDEHQQIVHRLRWPSWQPVAEAPLPDSREGCAVQQLEVSPDGKWIFAHRWSGQGDWGYDLLSAEPLQRRLGITAAYGYMTTSPAFSQRCDRLVIASTRAAPRAYHMPGIGLPSISCGYGRSDPAARAFAGPRSCAAACLHSS